MGGVGDRLEGGERHLAQSVTLSSARDGCAEMSSRHASSAPGHASEGRETRSTELPFGSAGTGLAP